MIRIEGLVKAFGQKRAVDGLSFSVERGEVLGFLGPNGAGKSTTMRMITGYLPPTAGRVSVGGHDVVEAPLQAKRLIGYLPEAAPSYPDMTVEGFLSFAAELRGLDGAGTGLRLTLAGTSASVVLLLRSSGILGDISFIVFPLLLGRMVFRGARLKDT